MLETIENRTQVVVGQKVKWLYTMRGGYNDSWYVDGTVTKITPKTIYVEAVNLRGKTVVKRVKPQNVKPVETTAPQIGTLHTFTDMSGRLYLCQIDAIQDGKVWAFGENADSFNGWFYMRVDKQPTLKAARRKQFSRAVDWDWITQMREDQLHPEQDEEFKRFEYTGVWLR
jgi:hypothetical protein